MAKQNKPEYVSFLDSREETSEGPAPRPGSPNIVKHNPFEHDFVLPRDGYTDGNPKSAFGNKKPNLALNPPAALIYMALGFEDGAAKYGPYNWRENDVSAMVYVAAAQRHLAAWLDGEENAEDSSKPHLGHAMACLAILADAVENDNLIDDRPRPGPASGLISKWTKD